jgi:uncharacterized membrane protein YoaK (UPF0700 family)
VPDANRRTDNRQLLVLALLTFATGLVDAASVLGLGHVFTANMTGNIVFLGFSLAGQGRVATSACVVALGAFLIGALVGGRLTAKGASFNATMALEALLMTGAAIGAWVLVDAASTHGLEIALLASAMGIQNASVRKLGVADMTTTVLTLTLTGLAADSSLGREQSSLGAARDVRRRDAAGRPRGSAPPCARCSMDHQRRGVDRRLGFRSIVASRGHGRRVAIATSPLAPSRTAGGGG